MIYIAPTGENLGILP